MQPATAGFRLVTVRPLLPRVSGLVPTTLGVINVSIDAAAGRHIVCCAQPAELYLPLLHQQEGLKVSVNGSSSSAFMVVPANRSAGVGYFAAYVHLSHSTGCTEVKVSEAQQTQTQESLVRKRAPLISPSSPLEMPLLAIDNTTRGDWIGRYGRAGYVLFGWSGSALTGSELSKLPSELASLRFGINSKGNTTLFQQNWNVLTQPQERLRSALLDPDDQGSGAAGRQLGAAHTRSFGTSTIDVVFNETAQAAHSRCSMCRSASVISLGLVIGLMAKEVI